MAKPNFTLDDISKLADQLIIKLHEATEGDEWEVREIEDIYSKIEVKPYDMTNIPLRNNVIQYLLAQEFISISPERMAINITYKGKKYVYELTA